MSRYVRERTVRVGALLATGAVAGLPLLAAGPAAAAGPEISFSRGGGLEALSCSSSPSEESVTVPAESTVTFVNRLGSDATLRIDGRDATEVKKDESTDVLFHRGPVQVALVPDCSLLALSKTFEPVSVKVEPADTPADPPSSQAAKPGGHAAAGGSSGSTSSGGSSTGTDESPAADRKPSASPSSSSVPPAGGGVGSTGAGTVEGPEAPGGEQGLAAEPLSSVRASAERGPNGLLAIIAAVCVVGVSAGAIRAIVAQRATRTRVA
jgi:hypothetical protein